jgi:bacteriochlorophyll 4-vinyl reductase
MSTTSPDPTLAWTIPEQTMWVTLQAITQATGPQAPALLTEAGLGRFLARPPAPESMQPVATAAELNALYQLLHHKLGDALTRLFHRNCGEIVATGLLQRPEAQRLAAAVPPGPPDVQLRWFAEAFAAWSGRNWAQLTITEDAVACYYTVAVCPACVGITGAQLPLCASATVIYQRLARAWLGRRVRVEEIACAAMGAPHCTYALYK